MEMCGMRRGEEVMRWLASHKRAQVGPGPEGRDTGLSKSNFAGTSTRPGGYIA
jgi:hypothetical protein